MKMKLAMIGVAMLAAAWMASGTSPTVRGLEQRVAELEQIVAAQSQLLMAHQQEIQRFSPLADEMIVTVRPDGVRIIEIPDAIFWVNQGWAQISRLLVPGDLYVYGNIITH